MRVFALSDVHADHTDNRSWVRGLSAFDYVEDVLVLAGDVSDNLNRLAGVLGLLRDRFDRVFFVPGNHELWVRKQAYAHSLDKFEAVLGLCAQLEVCTQPGFAGGGPQGPAVRIVPLFSWYVKPEEGPDSLFVPKPGEDPELRMWSDHRFVSWPPLEGYDSIADYFLGLNEAHLVPTDGVPTVSFSHFLPRRELIFGRWPRPGIPVSDPAPAFNFSRVAGCAGLDRQVRRLGARVHVYGHQHRNRDRVIDGVRYVSHCLGYPRERARGWNAGVGLPAVWEG